MTFVTLKIILALGILLLTLASGILPLKLIRKHHVFLSYSNTFASGIFLGAALLHLLPDAYAQFSKALPEITYPLAPLICLSVFIILILLEQGVVLYGKSHNQNGKIIAPALLIAVLSIHSLIEGTAIGINASFAEMSVIFFAVIAHKGSESFALASNLHRYEISHRNIIKIISFFALITPLGILGATIADQVLKNLSEQYIEGILNAVASGTFLYLGSIYIMEKEKAFNHFGEIVTLIIGVTIMAVVAIWL